MNVDEAKAISGLRSGLINLHCSECECAKCALVNQPFGSGKIYHMECPECGVKSASETSIAAVVNKFGRMKGLDDGKGLLLSKTTVAEDKPTVIPAGTASFIADDDLDPHAPKKKRNAGAEGEKTKMVPVGRKAEAVVIVPQSIPDTKADDSPPWLEELPADPVAQMKLPAAVQQPSGKEVPVQMAMALTRLVVLTSHGRILTMDLDPDEPDNAWHELPLPEK